MSKEQIQASLPGRWVSTTGFEQRIRNGVPEAVSVQAQAFVPNALPPRLSDAERGQVLSDVVSAQTALLRLEGLLRGMPDPNVLLHPMRRREAIFSSRIENTTASAREMALVEADQPAPRLEVLEVRNNLQALEHGVRSRLPLCLRLIREMHEILLSGVDEKKQPGAFRTGQVHIRGAEPGIASARFVPPPPGHEMQWCLDEFERFLNPVGERAREFVEFPIEIALVHYQFESIHPFMDGNGRLGRLLIPLAGYKRGIVEFALPHVSRYLELNREEYCERLRRVSTHGEWVAWIRFFCRAMAEDCVADLVHVRRLAQLREAYVQRITGKQTSVLAHRLIDLLFTRPAVTTAIVKRELDITTPPAQKHIDRLQKAKILREITGGNYGRVWVAEEIVRLIEQPD